MDLLYFAEHGISKTIPKGNIVDGSELNNWLENERKAVNGKGADRTPEQLEKLAKINIAPQTIDRYEKQWLTRCDELRAFIEEYGRRRLTRKIKGSENNTAVWLNSQRKKYREGKLTDDKILMLKQLGVDL